MMKLSHSFTTLLLLAVSVLHAQFPEAYPASRIYHDLLKANQLGSILYIAAHPDDENTRLISYFENEMLARTAYLSLTRGDGGQNLIGTEIGAAIGVLRTQELLAARRIDGGEQYFTRAVDFGYSKSSLETLDNWDEQEILADVVWVIRNFRPDVMVTRFPPNNYAGHGHHEASALLAEKAMEAAGDKNRFVDQLEYVDPWQPKRLYFNTSSWWNKDLPERARDNDNFIRVNVGEYNALLGETAARIASRSRSQHQSQGFGTDVYYGLNIEYMEYVMGDKANPSQGLLDGVDASWARISAADVGTIMQKTIDGFDLADPAASAPSVIEALKLLKQKDSTPMRDYKIEELQELLLKLTGTFAEAVCDNRYYTPGAEVYVKINLLHQYSGEVKLHKLQSNETVQDQLIHLPKGDLQSTELPIRISPNAAYSNHYWLRKPWEYLFEVPDLNELGKGENNPALTVTADLTIDGYTFSIDIPVVHKEVDPVKAVLYRPMNIVPEVTFSFGEDVIVSTGGGKEKAIVYATNHLDSIDAELSLRLPKGWTSKPSMVTYKARKKGSVQRYEFELIPDKKSESGPLDISFLPKGEKKPWAETWNLSEIAYDHIHDQIFMKPASIRLQNISLDKGKVTQVGYIDGPGDDVAKYLKAAGYHVNVLSADDIQAGELGKYGAVLSGIRAYNTREDLSFLNDKINAYVAAGGTYIVQYNTSHRIKSDEIGPFKFTIGRERVTDEVAEVNFLQPNHPVLNLPNSIGSGDFENWVQERGLYFASEWDEAFTPIIGWSDPGEPERKGGLIVAPYGKGYFVYTGISFFRQLPAGVPGAYRLLSNIMNLKSEVPEKP